MHNLPSTRMRELCVTAAIIPELRCRGPTRQQPVQRKSLRRGVAAAARGSFSCHTFGGSDSSLGSCGPEGTLRTDRIISSNSADGGGSTCVWVFEKICGIATITRQ
jgi:hypothetical protein